MAISMLLQDLPVEIIRNVAAQAEASAVIALSATCHSLRSSCWHGFVFREVLNEHRSIWPRDTLKLEQLSAGSCTETATWARYALAGERANELRGGLDTDLVGPQLEQTMQWAPHLIACYHPFSTSPWLALKLSEVVHGMQRELREVFCYAAAMLSTDDDGNDMVATSSLTASRLPVDILKSRSRWKSYRALGGFCVLLRQDIRAGRISNHTQVQVPVQSALASMLGVQVPSTPAQSGPSRPIPHPPSALDIPMLLPDSGYELPVPFTQLTKNLEGYKSPSWDEWLGCHEAALTTMSYLTAGRWTGYFTELDRRTNDRFSFHPMHDISFTINQVSHDNSNTDPYTSLRGTGTDFVGDFRLFCHVSSDGRLKMTKAYIGAHSWSWSLNVTPFGLFGGWGSMVYDRAREIVPVGAVWLWKEKWTDGKGRV